MGQGHWYETHENLIALARALDAAGLFTDTDGAIDFFEKPHKWSSEWEQWVAAGKPDGYDFDDPAPSSEPEEGANA